MGIPSYFSHIIKQHRKIIKKHTSESIDNLYLDSNSIIYDAVHAISYSGNIDEYESDVLNTVCSTITSYVKHLSPRRIIIAFDGVAPVAKLKQQRERRYKTSLMKNIPTNNNDTSGNTSWDTTAITPGTPFMNKLNIRMKVFCDTLPKLLKNVDEVIYSSWSEPGEGEHKIFDYIRNNDHMHEITYIYGLDADLIMLCLCHLHQCPNIFLYRETPEFIKSIDQTLEPNETYVLDINGLSHQIVDMLCTGVVVDKGVISDNNDNNDNSMVRNKMIDYIFLCFFLGNDFLPHFPALNIRDDGIYILLDTYKAVLPNNETIVNSGKINWKSVKKILTIIAAREEELFIKDYKTRNKLEKIMKYRQAGCDSSIDEQLLHTPVIHRNVEHYINPECEGWESRYYDKCLHVRKEPIRTKQICHNYLEGLEWTLAYYTDECKSWEWKYNYCYPPLIKDLINYVPYFETEFITKTDVEPIHHQVQLAYVLPPTKYYYLSKYNQHIMNNGPSLFSNELNIQWMYCRYFWESHIDFPEVDINHLKKILNINTIT